MAPDEIFREVADRRSMLSEVHIFVESIDNDEEYPILYEEQIAEMGAKAGLDRRRSVRLFKRLVEENYIRVRPTAKGPYIKTNSSFVGAPIEDLTDKGLREIHVLPPEQSLEGVITALVQVLEGVQADPDLKKDEKEEQTARVRGAITALAEMSKAVPPQVVGDAISRAIFGAGS